MPTLQKECLSLDVIVPENSTLHDPQVFLDVFLGLCSTAQQVFIYTLYHVFETWISLCYCMVHMNH